MSVIKKIKLSPIEKSLEDIVSLCSRIRISQEELGYLEQKTKENNKAFADGILSSSKYKTKEKSLGKERRRLAKSINQDIKNTVKKVDSLKGVLGKIGI